MKNKLTKIYNIFKQIENLNGNVGWDQTECFYYFYENNELVDCWKLLYGLFCENKNLKPSVFDVTLTELRKHANGFSVIYEFGNSEFPILVATFSRNGKHQISGKVKVEETSVSEAKEVEFVDGVNVDENQVEIEFIDVDDSDLSLLVSNNLVVCFHDDNDELIEIKNESEVQEYLELYNDNRLFIFKNELVDKGISENFKEELTEKYPTFNIDGVTPDGLYVIPYCKLFLDYLNNDCALKGVFHPDDSFDNYCDIYGKQIFTKNQRELYSKYLDDMFEMDADGNSEFVKIGYEDVYDFCMNYNKQGDEDWKSTTPAELKQFFDELKLDSQFNESSEDYLGFINIDTENDMTENYSVMKYIVNNPTQAEKYANFYGLTIESAQEGELIINIIESIDSTLKINNILYYVTLSQNLRNKNIYDLKFYSDLKRFNLLGYCQMHYSDSNSLITDSLKWTLPKFEKIIDPKGVIYEVDDEIFEMIQALEIKKNR